jgi:hypothetical protein
MKQSFVFNSILSILILGSIGCSTQPISTENEDDSPQFSIVRENSVENKNPDILDSMVDINHQAINLGIKSADGLSTQTVENPSFSLMLTGAIDSPIVNGKTLHATSVVIRGKKAYVSYNTAGAAKAGAIDIINFKNPYNPRLKSRIIYEDKDINALYCANFSVHLAQSVNHGIPGMYSNMEVIPRLKRHRLDLENITSIPLPSYATTSIWGRKGMSYATTGSTGGLYVFDKDGNSIFSESIEDARWVTGRRHKIAVLSGGNNPQINVYKRNGNTINKLNSFDISEAREVEAKSMVRISSRYAFIAGNRDGVGVYNLKTGDRVQHIPLPQFGGPYSSANGVSMYKDLLFVSNGGGGIYVAQNNKALTSVKKDVDMNLNIIGQLQFEEGLSANHIAYKKDVLVVAAGDKGIKIVAVHNPTPEGEEDSDD